MANLCIIMNSTNYDDPFIYMVHDESEAVKDLIARGVTIVRVNMDVTTTHNTKSEPLSVDESAQKLTDTISAWYFGKFTEEPDDDIGTFEQKPLNITDMLHTDNSPFSFQIGNSPTLVVYATSIKLSNQSNYSGDEVQSPTS